MRLLLLCLCVGILPSLYGQNTLAPPFGRQWGEGSSEFLQWAGKEQLDVTVALPAASPTLQIYTFRKGKGDIPGASATAIEARFHKDRLFEVTIFREFGGKSSDEVRHIFYDVKKELTRKLGEFELNGRGKRVDDSFLTREESFHFESAPGVFLLMVYSSLDDTLRGQGAGRFSLIYHNSGFGPVGGDRDLLGKKALEKGAQN